MTTKLVCSPKYDIDIHLNVAAIHAAAIRAAALHVTAIHDVSPVRAASSLRGSADTLTASNGPLFPCRAAVYISARVCHRAAWQQPPCRCRSTLTLTVRTHAPSLIEQRDAVTDGGSRRRDKWEIVSLARHAVAPGSRSDRAEYDVWREDAALTASRRVFRGPSLGTLFLFPGL
ncbi:hypothetical protein FOMPIDRAFT_1054102 [Fomitopsis schrenkii]|uniref:Uncharacterized protein n=1 Tax=Fomitopsis schrenkii TaxID=2126942 RepID=S8DWN3_FOMSC|nr:hypothetical protein FOMPIDRAFT_1054102 [Fomitopsis schrenkii]